MTDPFRIEGASRPSRWLVTCDHASNRVPDEIGGGSLGLGTGEMGRHIAYDIGAAAVASRLADALDAPAILSQFSRLVIDPNRGGDDPTLIMQLYDGTIIPGNRHLSEAERAARKAAYYDPYHTALAGLADRQPGTRILAVHSFTGRLRGRHPRPWQIGLLSAHDRRLADAFLAEMESDRDFATWIWETSGAPLTPGDNQPYPGHLPGDTIDRHALSHGRANLLLEIRQDLIETPGQQADWADRLAPLAERAATRAGV